MIAIVDYGMGNLRSVQKAFERIGSPAEIVSTPSELRRANKVVLPGVGAFRDAIDHLQRQGLVRTIVDMVESGRPFLGICLGLQLLFDISYEDGQYKGLGILPGRVIRFDFAGRPAAGSLKIPHMGWNQLTWSARCPLFEGLQSGQYFYFVHSYYVDPMDAEVACGRCDYGFDFTAMVWRDNLFAVQFHPEKSQEAGLQMIRNFAVL